MQNLRDFFTNSPSCGRPISDSRKRVVEITSTALTFQGLSLRVLVLDEDNSQRRLIDEFDLEVSSNMTGINEIPGRYIANKK